MKTLPLRYLSLVPITSGLGLSGANDRVDWPRYIRTTDIAGPKALRDDVFASQPPEVASAAEVQPGDILMTSAGTIGKSVTFNESYPACYAGFLVRVRPLSRTSGRFLGYWMQSRHYWSQIEAGAVKSTIENFSATRFRALRVPARDDDEQSAVADFLDRETSKIDALIDAQLDFIEILNERRAAVVARATTKGLDAATPLKDSGLGWVGMAPSHWSIVPHRSVLALRKEEVGAAWNETPLLSLTKRGVVTRDIESGEGKYPASFEGYQIVESNDLVFCLFDMDETPRTIGRVKQRGMITSAYTRFVVDMNKADPRFLEWYFVGIDDEKRYRPLYTGLRKVIQKPRFLSASMVLPPMDEQEQIAKFLDEQTMRIDELIAEAEGIVSVARERRTALVTAAVTGEIDVRDKVA